MGDRVRSCQFCKQPLPLPTSNPLDPDECVGCVNPKCADVQRKKKEKARAPTLPLMKPPPGYSESAGDLVDITGGGLMCIGPPDVPDLGERPASPAGFRKWCNEQQIRLDILQKRINEPGMLVNGKTERSYVHPDEFRVLIQIAREGQDYVREFAGEVLEEFTFPGFPQKLVRTADGYPIARNDLSYHTDCYHDWLQENLTPGWGRMLKHIDRVKAFLTHVVGKQLKEMVEEVWIPAADALALANKMGFAELTAPALSKLCGKKSPPIKSRSAGSNRREIEETSFLKYLAGRVASGKNPEATETDDPEKIELRKQLERLKKELETLKAKNGSR